jgi:hypothetical protein
MIVKTMNQNPHNQHEHRYGKPRHETATFATEKVQTLLRFLRENTYIVRKTSVIVEEWWLCSTCTA